MRCRVAEHLEDGFFVVRLHLLGSEVTTGAAFRSRQANHVVRAQGAMEPHTTALLPVRKQSSLAVSGVNDSSPECPIRRRVSCFFAWGRILRKGDCSSWTVSAWFSASLKTGSGVELMKSASTIVSDGIRACARCVW